MQNSKCNIVLTTWIFLPVFEYYMIDFNFLALSSYFNLKGTRIRLVIVQLYINFFPPNNINPMYIRELKNTPSAY